MINAILQMKYNLFPSGAAASACGQHSVVTTRSDVTCNGWSALNNLNLKSNQQLNWSNKWSGLSSRKMEMLKRSISKSNLSTAVEYILVTFWLFLSCKSVSSSYQSPWLLISSVSSLTTENWTWCFRKHALFKSSYTLLVNCWHTGEGQSEAPYLVVYPLDGGNFHVVGGGAHIFMLLVGEDVDANQVNLPKERLHGDVKYLRILNMKIFAVQLCVFFCFMHLAQQCQCILTCWFQNLNS